MLAPGCQQANAAPPLSVATSIRPASITSIGAINPAEHRRIKVGRGLGVWGTEIDPRGCPRLVLVHNRHTASLVAGNNVAEEHGVEAVPYP
jgi:hypothetical protein